jgi:hypothetical protein
MNRQSFFVSLTLASALLAPTAGFAQFNVNTSGFIRLESAIKLTGDENRFNQTGIITNGVPVERDSTILGGFQDTIVRDVGGMADNSLNLLALRAELDSAFVFSKNWKGQLRVRGFYDPDAYDWMYLDTLFETPFNGDCGTRLEVCGDKYMLDIPAAYVDYSSGGFWARIGNQQIAWGETLFFRVLDVPNGLDLRRHSAFDLAAEEYSDKRVHAPGIRSSFTFADTWEIEGFAQMAQPSILPTPNSPYNVIPDGFVIQQEQGYDAIDDKWNFGARLRGQAGPFDLQLIAVRRYNPDGVFRWTASNVLGEDFAGPGSAFVLSQTAFERSSLGVISAQEWMTYAADVRLDGTLGLDSSINEFQPWTGLLGAVPTDVLSAVLGCDQFTCAEAELDLFFQLLGPLRGHLAREYFEEDIFGGGFSYMFSGKPGSFLDQLILRFEATYTPDKVFTNPTLSRNYIEKDEWVTALVLEKYHRFSENVPSAYMVAQWMHKSESDFFGRHLSGMGASPSMQPTGNSGFDVLAFAIQQPLADLIWRVDLSVLYDLESGWWFQPAVRWKPNSKFTVEAFANIFTASSNNENVIQTVDWADEIAFRLAWQF